MICFFCKKEVTKKSSNQVNYKYGKTGCRGTYIRRACVKCQKKHIKDIRK